MAAYVPTLPFNKAEVVFSDLISVGSIAFADLPMSEPGYMNRAQVPQSVSAVSYNFV